MSEQFVVELPWGAEAVSNHAESHEISTILLQQNIISQLRSDVFSLQSELDGKSIWHRSALDKNRLLREQVAILEQEKASWLSNAENSASKDELEEANAQVARLISEIAQATDSLFAQRARADEAEAEVEHLTSELADVTAQLDAALKRCTELEAKAESALVAVNDATEKQAFADARHSDSQLLYSTLVKESEARAGENRELKLRLNEANQLIANQSELLKQQKEAMTKAGELAATEVAAAEQARLMAVSMSAELKKSAEKVAVLSAAMKGFSLEPLLKIEGKGQLHLMEVSDMGVFGEMKKLLGSDQPLWWWVEDSGYGHPVGLTDSGDLVTGERSKSYFERRIGKEARIAMIEKMQQFDMAYHEKVVELANNTYMLLAIRGTTITEDAIEFIRGLELLPEKEKAEAQLDTLQANLIAIHRATEKAEGRFQVRMCRTEQNKAVSRTQRAKASCNKKKKRK